MAKKQSGNEEANGGVVFDQRTKAVMATNHITTDNVKAKITKVRESVPNNIKKDDIAIVLDYFNNDTTQTIDAFNAGQTDSILKTWFTSGKKGGKAQGRNKKRRNRQSNQTVNSTENDAIKADSIQHPSSKQPSGSSNSTDLASKETTSSAKDTAVRLPQPNDNNNKHSQPNLNHPPTNRGGRGPHQRQDQSPRQGPKSSRQAERQGDGRNHRTRGRNQPEQRGPNTQSNSRRRDAGRGVDGPSGDGRIGKGGNQVQPEPRESTSSESSILGKKKSGANLERLEKDLHRTAVSLTRCKNNLTTQLEESEKRLKKAFQEVQRQLQEREIALLNDFNDIKRQTESLIDNRIQTASELRMKIAKASSLAEQELLELKASLKHFVSNRKTDEEIAQTMRFTYTPDQLIAEVKKYGEVNMEISHYSSRRPSLSSLSTLSRTTSVCEDNPQPLSRGVSLSESLKSPDSASPKSPELDLSAEADHFAAKIQQKFQARSRGGPPRNRPRNQSGGHGKQEGGGRRRQNSGSQEQRRRPQNNQEGQRRRQNSGNQEANRKRTNSGSGQKNNDGQQRDGNREGQRSPRREGHKGGNRAPQTRGPKTGSQPDQPEGKAAAVVEGDATNQPEQPKESPKKQRNFTRRQQHRKRQGNEGRQGGSSPKRDEGKESDTQKTSKPQENGPKATENGPKHPEKPVTVVENGPTVTSGKEETKTPPKIEIDSGRDSESGASIGSTPASSPGTNSGSSSAPVGLAEKEKVIPNGPLTNGKDVREDDPSKGDLVKANGEDSSAKGDVKETNGEIPTDPTKVKKIIEREKVESSSKEPVIMVNGEGSKGAVELETKEEDNGGEK